MEKNIFFGETRTPKLNWGSQLRFTLILGSENIVEKLHFCHYKDLVGLKLLVQAMRCTLEDLTSSSGGLTKLPAVRLPGLVSNSSCRFSKPFNFES